MIPAEILTVFFLASLALALAPGPDNIFVLGQSALYGHHAGLLVTVGLCTGLLLHTALVVLGIAIIFQTSVLAFTLLKSFGALYLLYLAWQAFRTREVVASSDTTGGLGKLQLYRRGIIMNISNPKVSIFFLAFLPQFADPARGSLNIQIISLGAVFMLATFLVFSAIALLAGILSARLRRSACIQRRLNWCTGAIFIALALRLVLGDL